MKITRIRVTNYRGIEELDAPVPERGMIAKGRNGAGKTSVLRAIRAALAARDVSPDAIRLGSDRAEILVDLDDVTVKRVITAKGTSTVSVETAAGDVRKKPQTWLTQALGTSPLDPLDFYLADKKRRIEIVVGAMPTQLTGEQYLMWLAPARDLDHEWPEYGVLERLPGLTACELVMKSFYDRRTAANAHARELAADADRQRAEIERRSDAVTGTPATLEDAEHDVEAALIHVAELGAQQKRVAVQEERFATTRARVERIRGEIEETEGTRREVAAPTDEEIRAIETEVRIAKEIVEARERELALAQEHLARCRELEREGVSARDTVTDLDLRDARLREELAGLLEALDHGVEQPVTADDVRSANEAVTRANAARSEAIEVASIVAARRRLEVLEGDLKATEDLAENLSAQVEFWRHEAPKRLLAAAKGIEGLTIEGESVFLDGKVIDALSGREQMRLAVEIARRANAATKILVVDGLERLDPEQLDAFVADATRGGWQLIGTKVDRGDIVLEAIETEEAEAAAQ